MTDDILKEAKEAFDLCTEVEAENRAEALDDIRFARLEEQWPEHIRKQRELDHRPCLTFNKLAAYRRQVVNDARQNRPQINVHPADDAADPAVAQVYNGLIRNIEYCSDADTAYDTALEAAVDGGFGYFRINTAYASDDTFDLDIRIDAVTNQFSVWGDPYDVRHDSAEWNTAFVADMIKTDDFKKLWPGASTANWDTSGYGQLSAPWMDGDDVMLAEYWTRTEVPKTIVMLSTGEVVDEDVYLRNMDLFDQAGVTIQGEREVNGHEVTCHMLSGAEVLASRKWIGKYIPIIPVYGDVVYFEGRRYLRSLIRSAKDAQRKFNYDRSMSAELTSLAPKVPFIGPRGSFKTDADKWATANNENHAYIEYDPVPGQPAPERQQYAGPASGAIQEAALAEADIKSVLGLFDASMGAPSNETSGRAILLRQKEGDVSTFHFSDNLSRAIRHGGRVIIDLIPKVFTGRRMVRVLDPIGIPSIVAINTPTQIPAGPNGQPLIAQPTHALQPGQVQTIEATLDLSAGKYDLAVESGPSFTTQREEAANQMLTVIQSFPEAAAVLAPMLAKNLDWPGADQIAPALQALQQGKMNPQEEMQAKLQAETAAAAAKASAEGQIKTQQLAQEGNLRQQEMQQKHALAIAEQQNQAELEKRKLSAQMEMQRQQMMQTLQLKREEAEAEFQLAQWTAHQSIRLKALEIANKADSTIAMPDEHIGGEIGDA